MTTATAMTTLDEPTCRRLLDAVAVGRMAVVDGGRPEVVVLNHVTHDGDVLVRTVDDALLARLVAADDAVPAVYEVDSAFAAGRSGWSVLARGRLERETDPTLVAIAVRRLTSWAGGPREVVLRLHVEQWSGRHVGES